MQRALLHAFGAALCSPFLCLAPACAQADGDSEQGSGDAPPPEPSEEPPASGELSGSAEAGARQVYTPEDFARYSPKTALDMLEQVPGFTIQAEDVVRGLGQASGNVLIDGVRNSAKSTSTRDQLSRITAANVARIELVDGASLDIPGLTGRVANVVTKASSGLSGRFEWRPQIATGPSKFAWGDGEVSVTGARGPVTFTLALKNPTFYGGSEGPNLVTEGSGNRLDLFNTTYSVFDVPTATGTFGFDLPGEAVANLNLLYERGVRRVREREYDPDPAQPLYDENLRTVNDRYDYEIGGDVTFPLGAGKLKLIALESYGHETLTTSAVLVREGAADSGSRFALDFEEGERIGRAEYSWKLWGADWQLSAEGAFNRLDQTAGLFVLDPLAGDFAAVPFPAGTGGVREDRYEASLSYGRPLTARLSLQASLAGEYSKIAQTGAGALSRTFTRPKGSLALAWAPRRGLDVSLRVERLVGQLAFGDFLAQVNLSNDNSNAGNNELRPAQTWLVELEANKDLGAWGSATFKLFNRRITDFVTIIPLPGGGESSGNIDRARRYGLQLDATVRTEPIGLKGGQFDITFALERSRLADPLTSIPRRVDRSVPRDFSVKFRHDIPSSDWAYGVEFRDTRAAPYYRVAETGFDYSIATNAGVFVEHKDVAGMTVQLRASNLLDSPSVLRRTVYVGPRDQGIVLFSEDRRRKVGVVFNLRVAGTF